MRKMENERRKLLFNNTIAAGGNQLVSIICAFILPRQMLVVYGSEINGLVSSISQCLSFVSLLDMGVSTVVQTSLYKPIAENNNIQRNRILSASSKFFKGIAIILLVYTGGLMLVYPRLVKTNLNSITTAILILVISFSSISEYLFGVNNQILLNADQKAYIQFGLRIVTTVFNTIICVVLMRMGGDIVFVKLVSSIIFLIRPIVMELYIRKYYKINFNEKYTKDPIEQKWNGMSRHIASFVFGNTDIIILTLFATLQDVSIYSVYILVVSGLNRLYSVCLTGIGSLFGDMYARHETDSLREIFSFVEWFSHNMVLFIFINTGMLLVDFVMLYTNRVSDANYSQPLFSLLLTIAYGVCCLRNIYNILICSVGHFKQTQVASIVEAIINIVISMLLVRKYGLVGVAMGTLVAVLYQQIYYFNYIHKNIICESYRNIIKQVLFDIGAVILIIILLGKKKHDICSYGQFFYQMFNSAVGTIVVLMGLNCIFYRKRIKQFIYTLKKGV